MIKRIENDIECVKPGAEPGGVEYAIVRESDGAFLFDADGTGRDTAWEDYSENGSWWDTPARAGAIADINGLADPDGEDGLHAGVGIVSRPWYYEEDLMDDLE